MPQKYTKPNQTQPAGQQAGLGYVPTRNKQQSGGGGGGSGGIIISGPPGNQEISLDPAVFAMMGMGMAFGQDGDDGQVGPPGAQGSAGAAGAAGAAGSVGPPGYSGEDGEDGAMGPPGPPGPAGANGAAGATGPQGPIGFAMDGADGEMGISIPGAPGPAGANGTNGATGPQGPIGFGMDGEDGQDGMVVPGPAVPYNPLVVTSQSGTAYSLTMTDIYGYIRFTSGSAVTVTVTAQATVAWPANVTIACERSGAGTVTFAPDTGVTINKVSSTLAISGQYGVAQLVRTASDTWTLFGALS